MIAPSYTQGSTETTSVMVFQYQLEEADKRHRGICVQPGLEFITYSSGEEQKARNWFISKDENQTATSSELKAFETLKMLTNVGIIIPNYIEVKEYLHMHNDMIDLVSAVCRVARTECFSNDTQLSLEVYHDPEITDLSLTLYARQLEYDKDIMRKIKIILASYGEMLAGKSGWFLVTTDFAPPM